LEKVGDSLEETTVKGSRKSASRKEVRWSEELAKSFITTPFSLILLLRSAVIFF
jgi:hypothetical protein